MEREKITLTQEILSDIAGTWGSKKITHDDIEYSLTENIITGSDPEDGGADHEVVFKRESDGKYFKFYYTDWDMDYNFDRDFPNSATEVFPKTITKIVFQ